MRHIPEHFQRFPCSPGTSMQHERDMLSIKRCPKGKLDLVFPTGAGNIENLTNITYRGLRSAQIAARVLDEAGKPKYGMHALRHFYASWCINRVEDGGLGLPPKNVQERLGHSKITMTLDTYGHLFKGGDDRKALDAGVNALLG